MQKYRIRLERGDLLEFTGELVSKVSRETVLDPHTRTVRDYALYRTEDKRYVLVLESRREIRSKTRYLRFETPGDVYEYVKRLEEDEEAAASIVPELVPEQK